MRIDRGIKMMDVLVIKLDVLIEVFNRINIILSIITIALVILIGGKIYYKIKGILRSKKMENVILRGHIKLFKIMSKLKVREKSIVFINSHSNEFNGNLKAVYDEILKEKQPYNIDVYLKPHIELGNYKKIDKIISTIKMNYRISTSETILLNDYLPLLARVKVRKETNLIQLWHAGGAFKKFGKTSIQNIKNKEHMNNCINAHGQYTLCIVSAEEVVQIYEEAFGIDKTKILPLGLPRADIFFDANKIRQIKDEFYKRYNKLQDKKIILYAPTYRDGEKNSFNLKLDLEKMCDRLSSEYIIVLKMHPFIQKAVTIPEQISGRVINLSYEDINELMIVADLLISDYSSLIFEFAIMLKPIVFYAYDLDKYDSTLRGFYYNYREFVPGPIVENTDELIECIQGENWDIKQVEVFARRFNEYFDGLATKRVVEKILNNKETNI